MLVELPDDDVFVRGTAGSSGLPGAARIDLDASSEARPRADRLIDLSSEWTTSTVVAALSDVVVKLRASRLPGPWIACWSPPAWSSSSGTLGEQWSRPRQASGSSAGGPAWCVE
ncbi:MAG: hypothetical protein H6730_10340 [Deltaproteobacteria bacterium]|nr:hypothetical protein [Deltaproteobacteria bacterium]